MTKDESQLEKAFTDQPTLIVIYYIRVIRRQVIIICFRSWNKILMATNLKMIESYKGFWDDGQLTQNTE
jgi:hypothetical protein